MWGGIGLRGKKIIRKVLILASIILVLYVIYVIKNITLYKLEAEIKDEFDNVSGIKVTDNGPNCTLYVYLDSGSYEFEDIEPIFIKLILKLDEEINFNYLEERHIKDAKGEMAFLHIRFYIEKGTAENFLFKFNSDKHEDFQIWELDSDKSVTYTVSDYKK